MNFFKLLFFMMTIGFSSCLKEEIIYHSQDEESPSPPQEDLLNVTQCFLQNTQKQTDKLNFSLVRNLNLKVENLSKENTFNEKLTLKFYISWSPADTILCQTCQTDVYIVINEPRTVTQTQNKYNLIINSYQYNHGFGFDKINLDFKIRDEQAFYQETEQQLSDFKFKTLKFKQYDKKFEYEFWQNGNKIYRYLYTFQFDLIFENTLDNEQIIEPIIRQTWLDMPQPD